MNDSILKDVVAKLSVDQPMAIIFQDGEVHYPVVKYDVHPFSKGVTVKVAGIPPIPPKSSSFRYDNYPRCKTAPHIEVVKRDEFEAWVSRVDISSVDRKHCVAVIVYGDNDTVACMTRDENYEHGFAFGSTEKAFYLLEKAEAA